MQKWRHLESHQGAPNLGLVSVKSLQKSNPILYRLFFVIK